MKILKVALLAEGVDRNTAAVDDNTVTYVALLAEGVDRNIDNVLGADYITQSPSSRRAWIEIRSDPLPRAAHHGRPPRGGRG